ncbi:MAG: guanylate kinase [Flavobacteriales bacterium]|nr:guanylate kinase [Flavobacteriales bacterium]
MMTGKCIILCAPSGAGKTSITKYLLQQNLGLEFSVSACTRAKRPNEADGVDYYFLTVEEFKNKVKKDDFIEWEEVYANNFYGTLKSEIERIWNSGKHVIFDVDVKGGLNLSKYFGKNALAVFIKPPSINELEKRLRNRGTESEETIQRRINKATEEMTYEPKFDVSVENNQLEIAQQEVYSIVKSFLNSQQ